MLWAALLSFVPAVAFLAGLHTLDTYRLVTARRVLTALGAGGAAALFSYAPNSLGFARWGDSYGTFGAPAIEEITKALYVIACVVTYRVGFPVDAAVAGFAVGTGFSLLENLVYLIQLPADSSLAVWLVRGMGTAIMHGGATAMVAIVLVTLWPRLKWLAAIPAVLIGYSAHAAYNSGALPPLERTALILVTVPALLMLVFRQSERMLARWLHGKLDDDLAMLGSIDSGSFLESPAGLYLGALRDTFRPEVVADMFCLLRLSAELSAKAKAELLQRELGFELPPDPERASLRREMMTLEQGLGVAARRALAPLLPASGRDQWERGRI